VIIEVWLNDPEPTLVSEFLPEALPAAGSRAICGLRLGQNASLTPIRHGNGNIIMPYFSIFSVFGKFFHIILTELAICNNKLCKYVLKINEY